MENAAILVEAAKQVPSLCVLCFIVWVFLKNSSEARKEFIAAIREVQNENIDARNQSRVVIHENTAASKETSAALQNLTMAVKSLEHETQLIGERLRG